MTESASAGSDGERNDRFKRGDSTSRRVLEEVLKQTATLYSLEPTSEPADLEPLKEVARQFAGHPLELEPVGVELIFAALKHRMSRGFASDGEIRTIAERVARTLFENPEAHERLSALWVRLSASK